MWRIESSPHRAGVGRLRCTRRPEAQKHGLSSCSRGSTSRLIRPQSTHPRPRNYRLGILAFAEDGALLGPHAPTSTCGLAAAAAGSLAARLPKLPQPPATTCQGLARCLLQLCAPQGAAARCIERHHGEPVPHSAAASSHDLDTALPNVSRNSSPTAIHHQTAYSGSTASLDADRRLFPRSHWQLCSRP